MLNKKRFEPQPHDSLEIGGTFFTVSPHPGVKTIPMPYSQEGRKSIVYQLKRKSDDRLYALKVFKEQFRGPYVISISERMAGYAKLPGMLACERTILTKDTHVDIIQHYPNLEYSVLMPWISAPTWQEVLLSRWKSQDQVLTFRQSLRLAESTAIVLSTLEKRRIAHCDIAGGNVMVDLTEPRVMLIDLEDMYSPKASSPNALPEGSDGYQHRTMGSNSGNQWCLEGDRFAGAILLAEMLTWFNVRIRRAADGEHYFAKQEMQDDKCERYLVMQDVLSVISENLVALFQKAWKSPRLVDAPTLGEWERTITEILDAGSRGFLGIGAREAQVRLTRRTMSVEVTEASSSDSPQSQTPSGPGMGLSSSQMHRLRTILDKCTIFDSNRELRKTFADRRTSRWQYELPEASTPRDRVDATVNFLLHCYDNGENALALFLRVLCDQTDPAAPYYQDLIELTDEIEQLSTTWDPHSGPYPQQAEKRLSLDGVPDPLCGQLQDVLVRSDFFDDDKTLKALFVDSRLSHWRDEVPFSDSPANRVRSVTKFLRNRYNNERENALVILLRVLNECVDPKSPWYPDLVQIAGEVEHLSHSWDLASKTTATEQGLEESISDLPVELYTQLRDILLKCGLFNNSNELLTLFVDARISSLQNKLPMGDNLTQQIEILIDFLSEYYSQIDSTNALTQFLYVLADQISPSDMHHQQFIELAHQIENALKDAGKYIFEQDKTGISPYLYIRLREILSRYSELSDDKTLKMIFTDERIIHWRDILPSFSTVSARVRGIVAALHDRYDADGMNALVLFLHVLRDRIEQGDSLHPNTDELAFAVECQLSGSNQIPQEQRARLLTALRHSLTEIEFQTLTAQLLDTDKVTRRYGETTAETAIRFFRRIEARNKVEALARYIEEHSTQFKQLDEVFRKQYFLSISVNRTVILAGDSLQLLLSLTSAYPGSESIAVQTTATEIDIVIQTEGLYLSEGDSLVILPLPIDESGRTETPVALQAHSPGQCKVFIQPVCEGQHYPSLSFTISVQVPQKVEHLKLPNPLGPRAVPNPDMALRIYTLPLDEVRQLRLDYVLYSPSSHLNKLHITGIPAKSVEISKARLVRIHAQLERSMRQVGTPHAGEFCHQLEIIGRELYNLLFSTGEGGLAEYYQEFAGKIHSWLILSDADPWIPWELVKPHGPGWEHDFLGARYTLGRWIEGWGALRQPEFPLGQVCFAQDTAMEQSTEAWMHLLTSDEAPRLDSVAPGKGLFVDWPGGYPAALDYASPVWGLHFAGYPNRLSRSLKALAVRDESWLSTETLKDHWLDLHHKAPLVTFGMQSLNGQTALTGVESKWMPTFIRAGASAFVSALWATSPQADWLFWRAFYQAIWQRVPLGEAVLQARQYVRQAMPDSMDWLAYFLVGDPMARGYIPSPSEGYTALECINHDLEQPLCLGQRYRFRASLRTAPPPWYRGRRYLAAEQAWVSPQVFIFAHTFETHPGTLLPLRAPVGDIMDTTFDLVPQVAGEHDVFVKFMDSDEVRQTLSFSVTVVEVAV